MVDESQTLAAPKTGSFDTPFRLVLHIGAGKTGTSSIQQTLRTQREELRRRGIWYLGLMCEHTPAKRFPWQRPMGTEDLLGMDRKTAVNQLQEVLARSFQAIRKAGCHTVIWSNESFLVRSDIVIEAIEALGDLDVLIVAYVRRHDAWARSAYIQWGLKHKTYDGPVRSFHKWFKRNKANFSRSLQPWLERFPDRCAVRNLDAVGDAVGDFMKVAGIGEEGLEKLRRNETPSPEELVLRILFNDRLEGKAPAMKFTQMLTGKDIPFDRPIDRILDPLLPTDSDLKRVADDCARDRAALNVILAQCDQPPIVEVPLPAKPMTVDVAKVTTAIFQIILRQAEKIQHLETCMENMKRAVDSSEVKPPSTAPTAQGEKEQTTANMAPVFAISTGRSGSTLAQRALNCHRDLVLWGEHHGFLNGFANAHALMSGAQWVAFPQTARDNKGPRLLLPTLSDPGAPLEWANPWSREEFEAKLRAFLNDYFGSRLAEGQRWGFKEIRYNNLPVLNLLRVLYPEGKFVFIRRDPIEVTRSKVFAFIKENNWKGLGDAARRKRVEGMLKEVHEHYRVFETFMQRHPGAGLVVDYEALVASPREVITAMVEHLALDPARYDWALAEQVMGRVITSTKRDEALVEFIRQVDASLGLERA